MSLANLLLGAKPCGKKRAIDTELDAIFRVCLVPYCCLKLCSSDHFALDGGGPPRTHLERSPYYYREEEEEEEQVRCAH